MSSCPWCSATGFVMATGVMCRTCGGTGQRGSAVDHSKMPNASEEQLAYEILRPFPYSKSPKAHVAELLCGYREGIVTRVLEPLLPHLHPLDAERVRLAIKVIRGESRIDDLTPHDEEPTP